MSSQLIAKNLTRDINFMIDFSNNDVSYWYDETDFNINDIANNVISNFPGSTLISVWNNGFKFRWNNKILTVDNYDEDDDLYN